MDQKLLSQQGVVVFVDLREQGSGINRKLEELGIKTKIKRLPVGDYLISDRVIIERKRKKDFNKSLVDGRLLEQASRMKKSFDVPLIILEGEDNLYDVNEIHPNAIRGALAALTIDLNIPILPSNNINDTSLLIANIARREQKAAEREIRLKGRRKPKSLKEQQIYLLSSLPGIGLKLAKSLLEEFGAIREIVNAPFERLTRVKLIGEKKAKKIKKIFDSKVIG